MGRESSLGPEQRPALRDPSRHGGPGEGRHLAVDQAVNPVVDSEGIVPRNEAVPGEGPVLEAGETRAMECWSPDGSVHPTARSSNVHHGKVPARGLVRLLRLSDLGQHLVDVEVSLEAPASQHHRQVPVLLIHGLGDCLQERLGTKSF